jgi:hypothetical protein
MAAERTCDTSRVDSSNISKTDARQHPLRTEFVPPESDHSITARGDACKRLRYACRGHTQSHLKACQPLPAGSSGSQGNLINSSLDQSVTDKVVPMQTRLSDIKCGAAGLLVRRGGYKFQMSQHTSSDSACKACPRCKQFSVTLRLCVHRPLGDG